MISYNYPTLFLTEGTTKDILITDGTVTVSGTDYTVTDDTIIFTNEDIESEAFELTQSLCSADQLTFGSCEAAVMKITARKTISTDIRGLEVVLYMIPDGDASKMIQLGVFKIAEDKQSDDHIKHVITAYDAMYDIINADVKEWYDTELPEGGAGETLADFRDSFLDNFGITAESVTLVNDNRTIRHTIEKDRISGSDIIRAICELNGVFGQITNEGKFRFKSLAPSIVSAADLGHITTSQYSDIEFAEHGFKSIKKVKIIRDDKTIVTSSQTATGNYNTVTIAYNPLVADYTEADLQTVANTLCDALKGHIYLPCTLNAIGNPLHEVGDPIEISTRYNFSIVTYILERRLKGVQALRDTYTANGEEYLSENLNSSYTQSKAVDSAISQLSQSAASSGLDFVETIRNIGFRLLDEPTEVSAEYDQRNNLVELTWTDPDDIDTNEPVPCTWAGTVVVRKEGSAPLHKWDGTIIKDSTIRDEYASTALVDNAIDTDKTYYYGIFPYHIYLDDANNTIKHYRYTKSIRVTTELQPVPYYLINEDTSYVSDVMTDYGIVHDVGNVWEFYNSTLRKVNQAGTCVYCNNQQLKRKDATRLYVDIEATGAGSGSNLIIVIYSKLPRHANIRNESSGVVKIEKSLVSTPGTTFPRGTVEIPLYGLDSEETFHVGFITADIGMTTIHKVWFDNQIEVVDGFSWSCDNAYLREGENTIIARYTEEGNRTFIKKTAHKSIVAISYPSVTGYCGPIVLSDDPSGCTYSFQGWSEQVNAKAAFEADGHI